MAVILPILKAILPHVAHIATVAIPAFTKKPELAKVGKVDPVIAKQIEELQTAVTKNAESIHILAEKLQQSILGIDEGAAALQREIDQLKKLTTSALVVALLALLLAGGLLLRQL